MLALLCLAREVHNQGLANSAGEQLTSTRCADGSLTQTQNAKSGRRQEQRKHAPVPPPPPQNDIFIMLTDSPSSKP